MKILPKQLALGLGASLLVCALFTGVWAALPPLVVDPAASVPAKETVALFTHITKNNAGLMATHFPILSSIPLTDTPSAVALLKNASGATGWALLEPQTSGKTPLSIKTSDQQFNALFTQIDHPLSRDYTYSVLRGETTDSLTAYLRFPDVQLADTSILKSLIETKKIVSIALTDGGLRLRFLKDVDVNFPTLSTTPKDIFAHPLLIAHLSNGASGLEVMRSLLQPTPLLVTETVLRQSITTLFGKDLSPAYELPALLEGQTTLQVAKSETGSGLRVVLEGQLPRNRKLLDRLTTLFTAELAAIAKEDHLFDDKFSMQTVSQDTSLIEQTTGNKNGWNIRTIHQKGTSKILLLGLRGSRYILSNDAVAFEKTAEDEAAALNPVDSIPAGLGLIEANQMDTFLTQNIRTVWPSTLQIPAGTGGYLKWKLTQEGSRITLLLKKI